MEPNALRDVRYEVERGLAWITIDRPERMNAFTAQTVEELIAAFERAWADRSVGVVALTGAGDRAFCAGGDQKQRQETGDYGPSASGLFQVEALHRLMRALPKPVIAAVNGLAVGGGHVLHVLCDLTIAADHARFGQAGPRVGSFDAGFGSAFERVECVAPERQSAAANALDRRLACPEQVTVNDSIDDADGPSNDCASCLPDDIADTTESREGELPERNEPARAIEDGIVERAAEEQREGPLPLG